jgi:hypothetical protein
LPYDSKEIFNINDELEDIAMGSGRILEFVRYGTIYTTVHIHFETSKHNPWTVNIPTIYVGLGIMFYNAARKSGQPEDNILPGIPTLLPLPHGLHMKHYTLPIHKPREQPNLDGNNQEENERMSIKKIMRILLSEEQAMLPQHRLVKLEKLRRTGDLSDAGHKKVRRKEMELHLEIARERHAQAQGEALKRYGHPRAVDRGDVDIDEIIGWVPYHHLE